MQGVQSSHPPGAVCLITGELTRYGLAMQSISRLKVPPGTASTWMMGVLVGHNINTAFQAALDNPALQWVFLMGDDHTFPADLILKLLDRNVDCIVPLCLNRAPPMNPTVISADARLKLLESMPASGLYRLQDGETCGDAGLLVKRHVLEKIGAPWHQLKKSGAHNAEDREFIARVMDAGFEVHVDMDNPIGHMFTGEFLPIRVDDHWEIRVNCGQRHLCDIGMAPR